nr:MAG TPA: cytochrome c-553 [Caudoviricetes sp.]
MSIYNARATVIFNGCAHCKHLHKFFLSVHIQSHLYF